MRMTLMILVSLVAVSAFAQDCTIGNPEGVVSYEPGWVHADVVFAQFTDPMAGDCTCDPGFIVDVIHCDLVVDATSSFTARAYLMDAVEDGACPVPGEILAVSSPVPFGGFADESLHRIDVPCSFQCAVMDEHYFLAVQFSNIAGLLEMPFTGSNTGVPDKQAPGEPCSSYMHDGNGWEDMVLGGFWGGLPITAGVSCCGSPIADDLATWGLVKALYQ